MEQQVTSSYHGFRIFLISSILFFLLVFPFMMYMGIQSLPALADRKGLFRNDSTWLTDSLKIFTDSIAEFTPGNFDSLINRAVVVGENIADTLVEKNTPGGIISFQDDGEEVSAFDKKGPFLRFFLWFFMLTLLSYIAGLIYNVRFKIFFKRKQRKQKISDKIQSFCKTQLLHTPLVNALIITLPNMVLIIFSLAYILSGYEYSTDTERDLFVQFFYLTVAASLLEFLFAFYWQKHRVQLKYIDQVYSAGELRTRVFRRKGGKIRHRYIIASVITTLLPLLIVAVYLILSMTSVKELGLDTISNEQIDILIGPWGSLFHLDQVSFNMEKLGWLFYVNAGDSLLMIIGICNGILVTFIYLLLLIKWTSQDITRPVKEILTNMRNTKGGAIEQYTIVRTNDEIGELAEGYNEMTRKIHEHMEHIFTMNRDLELTVEERTQEVVMQKEEIEAQKEEIEAQLDLTMLQRDTISNQKEQILDSIRYAEKIQSALLPPARYLTESLSDHFILFKPRDIVSGDYYWTTFKDGRLLIAVADCTGHGVPGAFLSVLGISSMNEIVNREGISKASQILEHLRNFVIQTLHQTGTRGEAQDGIEIALCIIDTKKHTLEFAGANRPLYLVRPVTGKTGVTRSELIHIRGDRMPIGIYQQEADPFTNHSLKLKKDDTIYLFSDGYADQLGGGRRKTFRSVHFRELLLQIQDKTMDQQKKILLENHESWRGEVEQVDDILVVGIRL
ncbi:MAG: SpoIIE family protein phosphatase [Bacteroidota bacterium]